MRRATAEEKKVYNRIVADATRRANEEFGNAIFEGSYTLDNKRQPTFALEPISLFTEQPFPEGTTAMLNRCINAAIHNNMDDYLTIAIAAIFSTPDVKPKAKRVDDRQGTLFDA